MRAIDLQRKAKLLAVYEERIQSLLADGYKIRHRTNFRTFEVCRMHHMSNGNDIVIFADLVDYEIIQKTNQVVTHRETF